MENNQFVNNYYFITNFQKEYILNIISIMKVLKIEKDTEFIISKPYNIINNNYLGLYITKEYFENNPDVRQSFLRAANILTCKLIDIAKEKNISIDDNLCIQNIIF